MTRVGLQLEVHVFTDKGRREHQEDYFYNAGPNGDKPWLGVVADGMGGHLHGDVASRTGVNAVRLAFDRAVASGTPSPQALESAVEAAQAAVLKAARQADAVANMGSTVVAFAIEGRRLYWCSAGDSRLYLHHAGALTQLSKDFTLAEDMRKGMADGDWSEEDIENSPQRKQLTSFLGTDNWRCDVGSRELSPGDVIVACTDGVYGTIESEGIAKACATASSASQTSGHLLSQIQAAARPKQDNSTAIVVRLAEEPRPMAALAGPLRSAAPMVLGVVGLVAGFGAWKFWPEPGQPDTSIAATTTMPAPRPTAAPAAAAVAAVAQPPAAPPPTAPVPAFRAEDVAALETRLRKGPHEASLVLDRVQTLLAGLPPEDPLLARLKALRDRAWVDRLRAELLVARNTPRQQVAAFLDQTALSAGRKSELGALGPQAQKEARPLLAQAAELKKSPREQPPRQPPRPPRLSEAPLPAAPASPVQAAEPKTGPGQPPPPDADPDVPTP
jgi:PPM family protein phosphatase